MNAPSNPEESRIQITLEDLASVQLNTTEATPGASGYGSVNETPAGIFSAPAEKGSFWLQTWCYLGLAGLAGSLLAWAICEPWFIDGAGGSWANSALLPMVVVLVCTAFGVAEGIAEHSVKRAAMRAALSFGVGLVLGFVLNMVANVIFTIGLGIAVGLGGGSPGNPLFWIARAIAWMIFGVSGGLVYGLIGQSPKRCAYGVIGGVIGAGLGGLLFDPISLALGGAEVSRAVGLGILGSSTGIAMGLVENALKDRWFYVAAGPLAGKQFVLYKPVTTMGSAESCDIYLFKDKSIQPQHARLELRGPHVFLYGSGPLVVNGRQTTNSVLRSGDYLQLGRYGFQYRDRERTKS
jgi:hypothetical protein